MKLVTILILSLGLVGCHKATVTAPVPGAVNTLDSWAFRVVSDSEAAITSVKVWEQCATSGNPQTVVVDGATKPCDPSAGPFPMQYKPQLNEAITAVNLAAAAGKAYHSGASKDTAGLTSAVNQAANAVTNLLSQIGAK